MLVPGVTEQLSKSVPGQVGRPQSALDLLLFVSHWSHHGILRSSIVRPGLGSSSGFWAITSHNHFPLQTNSPQPLIISISHKRARTLGAIFPTRGLGVFVLRGKGLQVVFQVPCEPQLKGSGRIPGSWKYSWTPKYGPEGSKTILIDLYSGF